VYFQRLSEIVQARPRPLSGLYLPNVTSPVSSRNTQMLVSPMAYEAGRTTSYVQANAAAAIR
jgi:hypothetical protein